MPPRPRPLSRRYGASPKPTRTFYRRCARRFARAPPSARSAAPSASSGVPMTRSLRRGTRVGLTGAAVLALAIPLAALASSRGESAPPSFTRDVAPVVQQKCAGCHQLGGIAPFPLETARQIAARSSLIAAAVQRGDMPPWPPGAKSPTYVGEDTRRLSARERATILAWARAEGRIDGPARKPLPEEPTRARDGESVLDLRMPAAYRPSAPKGTTDDYRCFLLDPKASG